jgi:tetratricopeptide (TPR) repeat protein
VAASDPSSYLARLYAGDVYFRKGNVKLAGEWFQQAIAIDPNAETAYRYWGDAIAQSGDQEAARQYFIKAIIAEPYTKNSWMRLKQWAKENGAKLEHPQLYTPTVALKGNDVDKSGKPEVSINIDPKAIADKEAGEVWFAYAINRSVWVKERYIEQNPTEKTYRHSLEEEVESMRFALDLVKTHKADLSGLRGSAGELVQLERDGMLESYVLLSAPDNGIARDYGKYRDGHRETLAAYIDKYVIRRGAAIE